ncbi:hypothetical protein TNCV_2545141 [Trichonephila clavipes]|nr:hypothetical protein TNCV_2545141 [Trichonephila clavipes]
MTIGVHEQMSRSSGQSEARPPAFKSPSKLGTHLSTHCNGYTEHRAGSQRSPIASSREARHVTRMILMDSAATSRALSQDWGLLQDSKCLHEQFDEVCSSTDSQFGDQGFSYP